MGKRQKEGMKSGAQGRKARSRAGSMAEGTKCQVGGVIFSTRAAAERASSSGTAKRCGRCKRWHPA